MTRKAGTAINNNYNNALMAMTSRLAAANSASPNFFSGDLNKVLTLFNVATNNVNTVTHDLTPLVLTNPLANVQNITLTNTIVLQLPAMNGQTPAWKGRSILIFNNGDQTIAGATEFNIYAQDGTTEIYLHLLYKQGVLLYCTDDSTPNGTFIAVSIPNGYLRRIGKSGGVIDVEDCFHTVLEASLDGSAFTAPLIGSEGMLTGFNFWIKNNSATNCTFTPASPNTIDGQAVLTLGSYESAWICCNGSTWETVSIGRTLAEIGANVQLSSLSQVTGLSAALAAKEAIANKDASGGYVGLTGFKINFKNAANTFTSFLRNFSTDARNYSFPDRDGLIADDSDIQGRQPVNANLTGLAALTTILTGPIFQKSASTYSIPVSYDYTGTTFNNLTNSPVVQYGDQVNFTNSGTITASLNGTGLGINFEFYINVTNGATVNFTGIAGTTITGITSLTSSSAFPPYLVCRATGVGNFHITQRLTQPIQRIFLETTTSRTLSAKDAGALIICSNAGATAVTIDTDANQPMPNGTIIRLKYTGAATLSVGAVPALVNGTNVSIGNNGIITLQKSATDVWELLDLYEEYTHTTNWSGIWASNQAGNIKITRRLRSVSITLPVVTSTANTAATISLVTALPARFQPPVNTETRPLVVSNASATAAGGATVSAGSITIFASVTYGNFTGSGTGGFFSQNFTYTV